jgi:DDE superfamily endonuclease
MWEILPSLEVVVQGCTVAFTEPTLATFRQVLLGWIMCLGTRTEYHVFQTICADQELSRQDRHPFDRFYNFFSRAHWDNDVLSRLVAMMVVAALVPTGALVLLTDDTLLHKRGKKVYGLGWFRDAVASTKKRVATASGNNWVVMGLAIPIPLCPNTIVCLPLLARLHLPGKGQPGCASLARAMVLTVQTWFPDRELILVGDGGYAGAGLLKDLPAGVTFVGRLRGDAAVYDPKPPRVLATRRGRKPQKGKRLPSPKEAAQKADRNRNGKGPWCWQTITVTLYDVERTLKVLSYEVVWPKTLGLRAVRVVVVRDPTGKLQDTYLFTTALAAAISWVVTTFGWRWSIEVAFKASKQVMDIEGPQHWCQGSIEHLAPWVWLMQTVVTLWYLTSGKDSPEAEKEASLMGDWDSKWSLRHMLKVLRRAILDKTINPRFGQLHELTRMIEILKNSVNTAL